MVWNLCIGCTAFSAYILILNSEKSSNTTWFWRPNVTYRCSHKDVVVLIAYPIHVTRSVWWVHFGLTHVGRYLWSNLEFCPFFLSATSHPFLWGIYLFDNTFKFSCQVYYCPQTVWTFIIWVFELISFSYKSIWFFGILLFINHIYKWSTSCSATSSLLNILANY